MRMTYFSKWALIATCMAFCGGAFAQSFTITSRNTSSDILRLDESISVVYNVSSSGVSGPAVPVLRTVSPSLRDSVVATWTGTTATSSFSNLTFNIHLYDDADLCSQNITFELLFYSDQFTGPVTANASNNSLLQFSTTGGGQVQLTHLAADTPPLPFPLFATSASSYFLINGGVSDSVFQDPLNRIYFWADYNMAGFDWNQQFPFLHYQLNTNFCALNASAEIRAQNLVSGDVIDATGATPVLVEQAPLGGAGSTGTLGTGVNVFDITDINPSDPDCGTSVRNSIHYPLGNNYSMVWTYAGAGAIVRSFRIYVGREGGCSALVDNFGTPPSSTEFRIEDFFITSQGDVSATLNVPAAWGSSSTLNSGLTLRWFLRRDSEVVSLGTSTSSLFLDTKVAKVINNPADYYLEARITNNNNGSAVVSTTNRDYNHNLDYSLQTVTFQKAEQNAITGGSADEYLDPGEIVQFPYQVSSPGGGALPTLAFGSGLVIDNNANGAIDDADTFLTANAATPDGVNIRFLPIQNPGTSGTSAVITYPFELLTAHTLPRVWFWAEIDRDDSGGTTSTYRRYFSLVDLFSTERDLNAEITTERFMYDFATGSNGWTARNGADGGGWTYSGVDGGWVGNGGTTAAGADDLHILESPDLPLGEGGLIEFRHLPQFSFNQSGAIFEYQVRTGTGPWTQWDNFIESFCSGCSYYNEFPFPDTPDSYLNGQEVWMSNESSSSLVQLTVPDSLSDNRTEIRYRFLFTDPSLIDTARSDGPTHQEVYFFDYETTRLLEDNIFGIDMDQLTWDACDDPRLVFTASSPISVSQLTFEWFESLDDLYADQGTGDIGGSTGASVPFNPTVNGTYTYYARIKFSGTERIIRVIVNKTEACTNVCLTEEEALTIIRDDAGNGGWPGVKDVSDCVEVINRICEPQ